MKSKLRRDHRGLRIEDPESVLNPRTSIVDPRRHWRAMAIAFVLFLSFLPFGAGQEAALEDPLPIKRVLIPAARLPVELEKVRQGVLVSLSRPDFEARVQKAALAGTALRKPPRLIKAEYRAVLEGNSLTKGRGEWTVFNPLAEANILPLGDLNLALEKVKTKEDTDAVMGDVGGKGLALVIEKAGAQPIFFDWTLRGISGNEGLQFELKLPPCALNVVELTVPVDYSVAVSSSTAILSGPHESEIPQQRRWRLHFAGRSQIDLVIRKKNQPGAGPLVLAQLQSSQQLTAGRCRADFDFRFEVLHGNTEQLVFACDPGLEPYEVTSRNIDIKGWELQQTKPGKTLVVQLREPFQGTLGGLQVRCLASVNADGPWTSPGLHLRSGLERVETLKLTLDPGVRLTNWQAGHFRLMTTGSESDGSQTMTLVNAAGEKAIRPGGVVKVHGVEFLARQKTWWQIGRHGSTLTTEIALETNRGKLFQLTMDLPKGPGWHVESVTLDSADNLGAWVVSGNRLLIEFRRALAPATQETLRVRLLSAAGRKVSSAGLVLDFPDLRIAEPCLRSGVLAIGVDAPYQATIVSASAPAGIERDGPWKLFQPQFYFHFKNEAVAGKLRLVPFRAKVHARCATDVVLVPGGAAVQTRVDVDPVQGNPTTLDLYVSAPLPEGWKWQSADNQVLHAERRLVAEILPSLLALGARRPLELVGLVAHLPRGQRWRLTLARPLDRKQRFVLQSVVKGSPESLEIPLVSVPDAAVDGTVSLEMAGAELAQTKYAGMREDAAASPNQTSRSFQYERVRGGQFPRLVLTSHPKNQDKQDREICDHADFTTIVDHDGRMVHQFRFRIWNWRQSGLPLVLPADTAQVLGARVDGRWLERVPQQAGNGLQILLTVPPDARLHHLEVLYASTGPGMRWPGWTSLQAPVPKLPVPPLSLQRRWRLPPGMEPLDSSFVCLTELQQEGPALSKIRQAWHAADPWLAKLGLSFAEDWVTPQRQLMVSADAAARRKLSKEWHLGKALHLVAVDSLGSQATLVLDADALKFADLTPATMFAPTKKSGDSAPFWESAGLVYEPCSGAPLLTTRVKMDAWNARSPQLSFGDAFGEAVTEAALHGQDRSGRFCTLDRWLAGIEDRTYLPQGGESDFGWSEWQPVAGLAHPHRMVVVRRRALDWIGIVLAVVCAFIAWRLGSRLSRAWFYRLTAIWLTTSLLALVWAPPVFRSALAWLALPAFLFALLGYVRWMLQGRGKIDTVPRPSAAAAALLLLLMPVFLEPAWSGGPKTHVVLLVQGENGTPQTALVPPELLKRLDELASRGISSLNRAVLTKARYVGTLNGSTIDFQADLECFSFADKAILNIPLDGVALKDGAFLNGQPVFPVAAGEAQAGYELPLTDKGFHKLDVKFSVRFSGSGPNKELRFSIPKLAQSQLELTFPKNLQEVQAINALGDQRLIARGETQTLYAHLGRENKLQVRWRLGNQAAPAAQVQVRELYFWDLRAPAPALNAILEYSVKKGVLPAVAVALPQGLEVRTVEVSAEASEVSKTSEAIPRQVPRLKNWRLMDKGGNRTLQIEFHNPIAGGVQVKLGFVPRLALAPGNRVLALPFPLYIKQDGFLEGFLAYRLEDLESQVSPQNLGVIGINAEVFSKAWRIAEPRSQAAPTRAFSFRRNAPKAALLLTLAAGAAQASQEITWHVGPQHAEWSLSCDLTSAAANLMLLEWQIPLAVVLAEVSGPHVRHWSRTGAVLQVWLSGPQKQTSLKLAGWTRTSQPLAGGKGRFDLPALILKNQASVATAIHLAPIPGVTMQLSNLQNLARSGEEELGGFSFVTPKQQTDYGASFVLAAAAARPQVDMLTVAEVHDRAIDFTSYLDARVPHGELRQLTVQLDRWSGDDVTLEVLELAARIVHKKLKDGHAWTIYLPAGITRHFSIRLAGRRDLAHGAKVFLPDVRVLGTEEITRYLALVGPQYQGEHALGLAPVKDIPGQLANWPGQAKQILQEGTAWRITRADWKVQVTPRIIPTAAGVRIVLAEQDAAVGGDGHWIHQATLLLHAKVPTDIPLSLPRGARLLALAVDEQPVSPGQTTPENDPLRVTCASGPHWLRLRWQFEKVEALTRPNLSGPIIQGIPRPAILGALFIPAGFEVDGAAPPAADLMFHRAEAQLELCKLIGEAATGKRQLPREIDQRLWDAQKRFAVYCLQAEIQSNKSGLPGRLLRDLRQKNALLMAKMGKEKIRLRAEKEVLDLGPQHPQGETNFALPHAGPAVTWRNDSQNPPRLILAPRSEKATQGALVASEVLLLALVGLGILSCLPRVFAWLPRLWPEQLLLLAWFGWYVFDLSAIGLAVIVIGISARIILAATWLQRVIHRSSPAAPGSSLHPAK